MEYMLFWYTKDGKHPSQDLVTRGTFDKITRARQFAYYKINEIKKEERTNILRKSSKLIEIIRMDLKGNLFYMGKIGTIGSKVMLFVPKKGYYEVDRDGAIKKMSPVMSR